MSEVPFARPLPAAARIPPLLAWQLLAVLGLMFCAVLLVPAVDRVRANDTLIVLLLGANTLLALYALTYASVIDGVSLRVIFWFYNLFFMGLVPLAQYITRENWIFQTSDRSVLVAAAYVALYQATFLAVYPYGRALAQRRSPLAASGISCRVDGHRLLAAAAFSAGVAAALAWQKGFTGYGSLLGEVFGYSGMRGQFAAFILRPATFLLLPFSFLWWRIARRGCESQYLTLLLAIIAAAVFSSPFGGTRFYVFAVWFGLFVLVCPPGPHNRPVFLLVLVGGLLGGHVIAIVSQWLFTGGLQPFSIQTYLYQGHFDGFENFLHGIEFVEDRGIVWGRQLLGALLFWVPRSIWLDKPIGTAAYVATEYLADRQTVPYTNLASPFVEEAYVNFHVVGLVAFTALLALAFAYLDGVYRIQLTLFQSTRSGVSAIRRSTARYLILYPIGVGLALFFLRGDMLSSVAYSSAILLTYELVSRLVLRPVPPTAQHGLE